MTIIIYQKTHDPVIPISSDLPTQVIVKIKGRNGNYYRYQVLDEVLRVKYSSDWTQIDSDDFFTEVLDGSVVSTLTEGTYLVKVDVATQPNDGNIVESNSIVLFLVTPTNVYLASLGTQKGILVIRDNYLGAVYEIGGVTGSVSMPISGRFSSILYLHDYQNKVGKLIVPTSPSSALDTGWGTYAIIRITLNFDNISVMRDWVYRMAYMYSDYKSTIIDIYQNSNITDTDKIKLIAPYTAYHVIRALNGRCLNVYVDPVNFQLIYDVYIRLGDINLSLGQLLSVIGVSVATGGAIALGLAVGGATGVGMAIVGVIVGGIALYQIITRDTSQPPTEQEKQIISQKAQEGRTNVENAVNDAISTLDYYYNQGQITQTAYENIKAEILNIKDVAVNSINELEDEAKTQIDNAYKDGYNDAKEDYVKWIAVSGAVGFGLGIFLGRR